MYVVHAHFFTDVLLIVQQLLLFLYRNIQIVKILLQRIINGANEIVTVPADLYNHVYINDSAAVAGERCN